jgi:hypothetical protein
MWHCHETFGVSCCGKITMEILNWSDAPQAAFGREQTQGDAGLFKTLMNAG